MTSDNEPWVIEAIGYYLSVFAEMATEEQFEERKRICRTNVCGKFGKVSVPGAVVDGCTSCRCPIETKPRVVKYFNLAKMRMVRAECPAGLWPEL